MLLPAQHLCIFSLLSLTHKEENHQTLLRIKLCYIQLLCKFSLTTFSYSAEMSMFAINFEAASQAPPIETLYISLTVDGYPYGLHAKIPLFDLLHGPNRPATRIGYAQFRARDCEPLLRPGQTVEPSPHYDWERIFEVKIQEEIIGVIPHFLFKVRWVDEPEGRATTQSSVLLVRPPREPEAGASDEVVLKDQFVQRVGLKTFSVYIRSWDVL